MFATLKMLLSFKLSLLPRVQKLPTSPAAPQSASRNSSEQTAARWTRRCKTTSPPSSAPMSLALPPAMPLPNPAPLARLAHTNRPRNSRRKRSTAWNFAPMARCLPEYQSDPDSPRRGHRRGLDHWDSSCLYRNMVSAERPRFRNAPRQVRSTWRGGGILA